MACAATRRLGAASASAAVSSLSCWAWSPRARIAWYGWDWWRVGRFIETTDDAYVGGNVTTLSPHVAGFVAKILVGDNQFVHAGQTGGRAR